MNPKYNWKSLYEDIKEFVKKCTVCLESGGRIINTKNNALQSKRPYKLGEIEIISYLDQTRRGNKYILTAIDHYSKWPEASKYNSKTKRQFVYL